MFSAVVLKYISASIISVFNLLDTQLKAETAAINRDADLSKNLINKFT